MSPCEHALASDGDADSGGHQLQRTFHAPGTGISTLHILSHSILRQKGDLTRLCKLPKVIQPTDGKARTQTLARIQIQPLNPALAALLQEGCVSLLSLPCPWPVDRLGARGSQLITPFYVKAEVTVSPIGPWAAPQDRNQALH